MARKSGWEDSTKSPDWIDVETMSRAMSALHSGIVGLTILPRGIGSSGGLSVAASIMWDRLPGSALPPFVNVVKDWPCTQHKTLAAHAYGLLHELDSKIGQTYENKELWN